MNGSAQMPLSGYTVLDLSGSVGTAVCGRYLADFGARVINVEAPSGHPTRGLGPCFPGESGPEASGLHTLLSPGKQSLVADISTAQGRESLEPWLRVAEVVLEAERPGELSRRGLGPGHLESLNPGLLLCSLTWWGQDGPLAGAPANDASLRCHSGQVLITGPVQGPPILPSGYQTQVLGGTVAFAGILQQLTGRLRGHSAGFAHLDVSLFEATMCLTETGAAASASANLRGRRLGINRFAPTFPMGIYETKEGWLGVSTLTPSQWKTLCRLIGIDEVANVPEYQVTLGRLADADAIDELMRPALMRETAEHWFREGQARRIPLALVPTMAELFQSEQMRARGSFRTVLHPTHGALETPAAPFRLYDTPARSDGSAALLGHHDAPPARRPHVQSVATKSKPSLEGLRVLDLSMGWAGPLAARYLADAGAEVIKIESCAHFDWWRGWEATPESLAAKAHEKAMAFNIMNRNKLGITLDLGREEGCRLFKRLVEVSDVVIENYSAGVLPKLGLDWPALSALNPRLVMLSMPPFGAGGPWHHYRAYGSTVEQASGLPHLQGAAGDPPIMQHVALGDPVAGVHAAAALLTAILHQQRTGQGQFLDLSQVEAVTALGLHGIAEQVVTGHPPARTGNRHPLHAPQGVYPCAGEDQWVMLCVDSDAAWARFIEATGIPGLADGDFSGVASRSTHHDAIDERIRDWTSQSNRDDVVELLQSSGVIAAPLLGGREVLDHPQLAARHWWQWMERAIVGDVPHPGAPFRVNGQAEPVKWPAPTIGEHTSEVLGRVLGLSSGDLDELKRLGVIGTEPIAKGHLPVS